MSLRTQLTLLTALSVAIAVVAVSLAAYFAASNRLRGQIDDALHARATIVEDAPGLPRAEPGDLPRGARPRDPFGQTDTFFQVIDSSGNIVRAPANQEVKLPVSADDVAVANNAHTAFMRDVNAGGMHLRLITSPGQTGEAVQVARSLSEVDASLSDLRNILLGVSGAGVAFAAIVGLVVAQRSLRPVARLTAAAEHVASTQNLEATIEVNRNDEIGRLARAFNEMLGALHESRLQQRQLVTDASHELRTPLTSLRTNIEVLARAGDLTETERRELLRDVTFELEELTKVVTELVELASDTRAEAEAHEDVRLDQLAASIVERFARRSGLRIELYATADARRRQLRAARTGGRQSAGQCMQVEPAWRNDRGDGRGWRAHGARSRPRHHGYRSDARVRPVLSSGGRAGHAGLRPRPRDRQADHGRARRHRDHRGRARRRHRRIDETADGRDRRRSGADREPSRKCRLFE